MSKSLDFVIGGMPRGGTTAAGNIFNVHPDSYCYASETHWIPLLMEFAEYGPVPDIALDQVEKITLVQNRQVLYEMARFSVSRGAHPRALIFEEADMQPLTSAMVGLMRRGLYGRELIESALAILRQHIVERTGKQVVGEKTPNNVFAFRKYGALGTKAAFMVVREPYSVIRSMHNRGKDAEDIYAGPFRSDLVGLIGIWNSYVSAILDAKAHESTVLLTYEDMMARPNEIIRSCYEKVGLRVDDTILDNAGKLLRERTGGLPWAGMSPAEQALVWNLTRPVRERAGYGDDFFHERAPDASALQGDYDLSEEKWLAVHGVNAASAGESAHWLMREGAIALQSKPGRQKVTIKLWSNFPVELVSAGQSATISFHMPNEPNRALAVAEAKSGTSDLVEVTVDLRDIAPLMATTTGEIRIIDFRSSVSHRSYLTPVADGLFSGGLIKAVKRKLYGGDRREVSFALVGVSFS